ncbi:effector-associated constant component EACC1 [Streptomyces sp. NRRL S-337]|uniref:effector-associated constant component EACC1 n=1 Tax=Streptomyces sp. NRRL S-337 TaxID=1463900 RepID=UPI0004C78447|nr:hypothetical protein [Streptomyces sp. NRRL S-337]
MELRVRVAHAEVPGDPANWTGAFADWLVEDRRLGRHADIRRGRSSPSDGRMSADLVSWISLAVASGSLATDLITVYGHFRASLPRRVGSAARLIVEHGESRIIIEEGTAEDAARVMRALNAAQAEDEETSHIPSAPPVVPPAANAPQGGETGGGAA